MSTELQHPDFDAEQLTTMSERLDELEAQLAALAEDQDQEPKMVIVGVHGSLDMAYPTLILSSLAAAMDWDVTVFASFWALDLLHKDKSRHLKVSPVGNPSLGMPNLLGVLPGMTSVATRMMERKIDDLGVDTVEELIERAIDNGVKFQACQMTADLMGYEEEDFIDGVQTGVGAATALLAMQDADVQLVI